jgi:hypothetical protein
MAKKQLPRASETGCTVRQSTALGQILDDLQSPDAGTRADAVRLLCPCRTKWDVPVQRYIAAMRDDPSSTVRHEVHHVLDEDSNWGKRLAARRAAAELADSAADGAADGELPGPYSLGWRRRKPRNRGRGRTPQIGRWKVGLNGRGSASGG